MPSSVGPSADVLRRVHPAALVLGAWLIGTAGAVVRVRSFLVPGGWVLIGSGLALSLVGVLARSRPRRWSSFALVVASALVATHTGIGGRPVAVVAASVAVSLTAVVGLTLWLPVPSPASTNWSGLALAVGAGFVWASTGALAPAFGLLIAALAAIAAVDRWSPTNRVDAGTDRFIAGLGRRAGRVARRGGLAVAVAVAVAANVLVAVDARSDDAGPTARPAASPGDDVGGADAGTSQSPATTEAPWTAELLQEAAALSSDTAADGTRQFADHSSVYTNVRDGVRRSRAPFLCDCRPVQVWVVGGTAAFGIGQRDGQTLASELVRRAAEEGIGVRVQNLGTADVTVWQEYAALRARLERTTEPPDLVVFYDGFADVTTPLVMAAATGAPPDPAEPVVVDDAVAAATSARSYTADEVNAGLVAAGGADVLGRQAGARLAALRAEIRADLEGRGIAAQFVFPPDALAGPDPAGPFVTGSVLPEQLLDAAGSVLDAAVATLGPDDVASRGWLGDDASSYFLDLVHPDEAGIAVVAAAVTGRIMPLLRSVAARNDTLGSRVLSGPVTADDPLATIGLRAEQVATVSNPTTVAARPGTTSLYVGEREGRIRRLDVAADGTVSLDPKPALDLTDVTKSGGQNPGLLGLAFSADGSWLYVHLTDRRGTSRLAAFRMEGNVASTSSRRDLLDVEVPDGEHVGGAVRLAPDGMLWMGLGDGGRAIPDPGEVLDPSLGKILRIDPSKPNRPTVMAAGFRNPWRISFDRGSGDLWIGDVGSGTYEEVDRLPAGTLPGADFGWTGIEGTEVFVRDRVPAAAVDPVFQYSHHGDCDAITGGVVYRGTAIPALSGRYLFGDFCHDGLRALVPNGSSASGVWNLPVAVPQLVSIDEDLAGEVWLTSLNGGIYRLRPA